MRKRILSTIMAFSLCLLMVLPYVTSGNTQTDGKTSPIPQELGIQPYSDDPPAKHEKD